MSKRRIEVNVSQNETIENLAQRMVDSVKENTYTYAVFDGVELEAGGGDTADDIVRKYKEAKK